ncbi:MAG: hypothetical protein APR63_05260 [Desulfuromonas sp. SDB]|nr:MAG: hypothetical protein APR63_05260 [Desulfuromonas sp. SDB]
MKRKILIGILVVLGIAVAVINQLVLGILAIGVWIYLFRIVRKQKHCEANDQRELKISEGYLKWIKALLIMGGFSFLVFIVGAIVHNVLYGLSKAEDSVFIIIALIALIAFALTTAGGLVIFFKGREKLN